MDKATRCLEFRDSPALPLTPPPPAPVIPNEEDHSATVGLPCNSWITLLGWDATVQPRVLDRQHAGATVFLQVIYIGCEFIYLPPQ